MKLFINNQYIYICKNQKVIFRSNNSLKVGYSKTNLIFSIFSSFKLSKFRKKKSYHDILHNFFYQWYFFSTMLLSFLFNFESLSNKNNSDDVAHIMSL